MTVDTAGTYTLAASSTALTGTTSTSFTGTTTATQLAFPMAKGPPATGDAARRLHHDGSTRSDGSDVTQAGVDVTLTLSSGTFSDRSATSTTTRCRHGYLQRDRRRCRDLHAVGLHAQLRPEQRRRPSQEVGTATKHQLNWVSRWSRRQPIPQARLSTRWFSSRLQAARCRPGGRQHHPHPFPPALSVTAPPRCRRTPMLPGRPSSASPSTQPGLTHWRASRVADRGDVDIVAGNVRHPTRILDGAVRERHRRHSFQRGGSTRSSSRARARRASALPSPSSGTLSGGLTTMWRSPMLRPGRL